MYGAICMRAIDLTGQVFGRLTAKQRITKNGRSYYLCDCECGNETTTQSHKLKSGHTQSCGCLHREFLDSWDRPSTHGETNTYLHRTWGAMKHRCRNPNNTYYHRYGGRGITYDPLFETYEGFRDYIMETIGERPDGLSLDRIDNDGNYSPGNLRWATQSEQNSNRATYAK